MTGMCQYVTRLSLYVGGWARDYFRAVMAFRSISHLSRKAQTLLTGKRSEVHLTNTSVLTRMSSVIRYDASSDGLPVKRLKKENTPTIETVMVEATG